MKKEDPLTYRPMPDLDPSNDAADKKTRFKREKSQIPRHHSLGIFDQASANRLITQKGYSAWFSSNGDALYDDAMIVRLIFTKHILETKAGAQFLRDSASNAKVFLLDNSSSGMLYYIASVMTRAIDSEEDHDNLTKDTFEALITVPNS